MLNRRAFLQRFGIGVSAALALASLPASAVQALTVADAGQRCATEYLLRAYRAYMVGKDYSGFPLSMSVSPGLFEAFRGELTLRRRFVHPDTGAPRHESLMFKATPLFPDPALTGWDVRVQADDTHGRDYAMNTTGAVYA